MLVIGSEMGVVTIIQGDFVTGILYYILDFIVYHLQISVPYGIKQKANSK